MDDLWYKNAVIYGVDVDSFMDSDGDGVGDFRGLTQRLDYLKELGITCLWVLPFYPTPDRDNGYDVANYYGVDRSHGTLDDFLEFVQGAGERGIRVIIDLVVNHTSNEHPWFQAGRRDPRSRYRDYYVWAENPPPIPPEKGTIFPGEETSVWTYDDVAGAYYYHRFYHFEPELNLANPEVRGEICRIMDYWLSFGVSGFRVDAAPHLVERKGIPEAEPDRPHAILKGLRSFVEDRKPGAVLLGETDVQPEDLAIFFGDGDELNLSFNFLLDNYLFLALARESAEPLARALNLVPAIPHEGHWANFLRNLDELDLERLSDEERQEVYEAFAPEEEMRIYGRGIRRRLAPMLKGDLRRLKMAYSLLFSLPGSPTLVYGDEIGMGDDLSKPGRDAVRTPMQWSDAPHAGFSTVGKDGPLRSVVDEGPFSYDKVNVQAQRNDPDSLLNFMRNLIMERREAPEIGWGAIHILESDAEGVFAHRMDWKGTSLVMVHNLCREGTAVLLDLRGHATKKPEAVFGNAVLEGMEDGRYRVELEPYGHQWIRVSGTLHRIDIRQHP